MRVTGVAVLVLLLAVPIMAAADDPPRRCAMCAGAEIAIGTAPETVIPLLVRVPEERLTDARAWASSLPEAQLRATTVLVEINQPVETIEAAEALVTKIASELEATGRFDAAGIRLHEASGEIGAYLLRRLAVLLQGRQVASAIVVEATTVDALARLASEGALPYFDLVLTTSGAVDGVREWIVTADPTKRLLVSVPPSGSNPLFDVATAFGPVVRHAYLRTDDASALVAIAALDAELSGDFARDPSSGAALADRSGARVDGEPVVLVRGEDLRTLVVPPGNNAETRILSLSDGGFVSTTRHTSNGPEAYRDTGRNGGNFLIGLPPQSSWVFFALERPSIEEMKDVVAETIDVRDTRGITIEEIIRSHQAYQAWQQSITPRYIARNQTDLRFSIGPTSERFEVSIAGPQFFDGERLTDWLWEDFFVNGVKWRFGDFPELPIVQAEKVTQLPLEINLTNEYRYELAGEATVGPFETWEVRFAPPPDAPADLPLYRGTVWIDKRTFARVRIRSIQLNLSGDVLSNEEVTDYAAFDATTSKPVDLATAATMAPRSILWLPESISMQMVVSAITRPLAVERRTAFSDFRLSPPDFTERYASASASERRMVRDTDDGLRYLVQDESGQRVVKDGFDTSQLFLLGGVRVDDGLDPPVLPLAGINYFDWNFRDKDVQTNVFFAGVILAASLSDSSFAGTKNALGVDVFGLAIPFENTIYRDGEENPAETVETQPFAINTILSRQVGAFTNLSASLTTTYVRFNDADDTDPAFVVPTDTWVITPAVELDFDRWGYSLELDYEWGTRTDWEPWGLPEEYDEAQKDFQKWGITVAKGIFLPKFQRLGLEASYVDGTDLDRFSKYELGFFGTERVRGIRSESVRAERMVLGHVQYGLVLGDLFRVEAFYDIASVDDDASGFDGEIFQGVGIGGQTVGPWGTIIRFDVAKSVGSTRQDGIVGSILVLKIFD